MTRDKDIGPSFPPNAKFPGRMDDKTPYGDEAPIGVRWHYNYSAFRPGFSFADGTPLDSAVSNNGYGVGTSQIQMASVTTCQDKATNPDCQEIGTGGIDPDIVLGIGGSTTSFRGKVPFTKEALRDSDAVKTNLAANTKYQRTFPELHPYNGYSFARTRAWTSSVAPGKACSCRNRAPEYRCFDTLLTDTKEPLMMRGDTVERLRAYIQANFSGAENTTRYAESVLSSLVLASCGFFWKGDNKNLVFGLPMYGQTDEKFYVYQHNVYNGDYYTAENLAALTASNTSAANIRQELQQLVFRNPVDASTLVHPDDGGGVWEFPSTCLRWPYGHAHIQSFSADDAQRLVRDTQAASKKAPAGVAQTRVFDSDTQLGYCDLASFSTGGNSAPEQAHVYCMNDPNTAEGRAQFCSRNKHAGDRFGGLRIDNPDPSTMCNDVVCLFVPGHRSVPTLRDFFKHKALDLRNKTVLVAPFNTSVVEYGLFFEFLVNSKVIPGADNVDNGVSFVDRRAFAMFAAMPPHFTPDDVRATTSAFVRQMCPQGRDGLCRQNSVPGGGAPSSALEIDVESDKVLPPMDTSDVRISQEGVTVESAFDYMWFSGTEKHASTYTRFNVGARGVHIGPTVADQQGCSAGFKCAAVVFSGTDVGGSSTEGIVAQNTDVAVMALGLDTAVFGKVGQDLAADGLAVGVAATVGQQYAFAAAAATGNMTVDCGTSDRRCGAVIQPLSRDSMAVTSPDAGFFLFNLTKATGFFGEAEERRIFTRPPDQTATLFVAFTTIVVAAALTLFAHIALFVENRQFCIWLVAHAIAGKNLERQPSAEAAYPWCVRWSPNTRQYVVYASDGSSKKLVLLAPLATVIARVVTGIDGGCEPYIRHIGLVEYAKECLL